LRKTFGGNIRECINEAPVPGQYDVKTRPPTYNPKQNTLITVPH